MTTTVLTPTPVGFNHLLVALQRLRSVAAEGGYLDLLTDTKIAELDITVPGLDRLAGDDRTLGLIADLAMGERTCNKALWMNLAQMVKMSPSWQVGLIQRGVHMPDIYEAIAQYDDVAA